MLSQSSILMATNIASTTTEPRFSAKMMEVRQESKKMDARQLCIKQLKTLKTHKSG